MLDAWIANQDRHHANWGLIVTLENENMNIHLAPTVDHASGLGRNETDNNIKDRLKTRDQGRSMARYVERALSAFYNSPLDNKPMSTLEAFFRAAKRRPLAARSWLERLANLTPQDTLAIFANVPPGEITPVAVDFAQEILNLNQQRLLRLETDLQ